MPSQVGWRLPARELEDRVAAAVGKHGAIVNFAARARAKAFGRLYLRTNFRNDERVILTVSADSYSNRKQGGKLSILMSSVLSSRSWLRGRTSGENFSADALGVNVNRMRRASLDLSPMRP
jgi:hypothetical protein